MNDDEDDDACCCCCDKNEVGGNNEGVNPHAIKRAGNSDENGERRTEEINPSRKIGVDSDLGDSERGEEGDDGDDEEEEELKVRVGDAGE